MDVCKIMKTRSSLHREKKKRMVSKRMFQQNKFQAVVGAKQSIPIYQDFYSLENLLFSLSVNLVKEDTVSILLFLVVSSCQRLDTGHLELVTAILRWDRSFF